MSDTFVSVYSQYLAALGIDSGPNSPATLERIARMSLALLRPELMWVHIKRMSKYQIYAISTTLTDLKEGGVAQVVASHDNWGRVQYTVKSIEQVKHDEYIDIVLEDVDVQASTPIKAGEKVVVYRPVLAEENHAWIRSPREFFDGRFIPNLTGDHHGS